MAAELPALYTLSIYNNDGSTLLYDYIDRSTTRYYIKNDGIYADSTLLYKYSGTKRFTGLSLTANSKKPDSGYAVNYSFTIPNDTTFYIVEESASKGKFLKYVLSNDENKYPDGDILDGYYYEKYEPPIGGGEVSKNIITFTIDGTSYQAEDGMTWAEWVDSSYNNGLFYADATKEAPREVSTNYYIAIVDTTQLLSDVIDDGTAYNTGKWYVVAPPMA